MTQTVGAFIFNPAGKPVDNPKLQQESAFDCLCFIYVGAFKQRRGAEQTHKNVLRRTTDKGMKRVKDM